MRTDILSSRKGIHIKLDKDVHLALRLRLFKHNLSMQEIFDEFARLIAADDMRADRMIEQLVLRKTKELLEGRPKKLRRRNINELDHDTLYSLIVESSDQNEAT